MKLVSIIVPVYNAERTLEKCVLSLLNQTYQKIEILLINDGSKDSSGNICDDFAAHEEKIKAIHKTNGGVSSARNTGLDTARGEYIQFVDSDDWIEPDYTKLLVDEMERNNAELVISGGTYIENEGTSVKKLEPKIYESANEWSEGFGSLYRNYYLNASWNKLFLADKIRSEFPEQVTLGEDLIFVLEYLRRVTKIALTDAVGYCYDMRNEGSLTRQYKDNEFQIAKLLYQKTKEYSIETFGKFCGKNDVKYIFLQDLRRHLFQLYMKDDLSREEKMGYVKSLSRDDVLRECLAGMTDCSVNQKILFWLLGHENIRLLFLYLRMGWRK